MQLTERTCGICGNDAPDDREFRCRGCGKHFHVGCAVRAGHLRGGPTEHDVLSGPATRYDWSCPDCDQEGEEAIPA